MKRAFKALLAIFVLVIFMCSISFAAPETLPADCSGNSTRLLTVTNPASSVISSYDKQHNISGYAANGAEVSVYILSNGRYSLMKRNGAAISCKVGASGMFVQPVTLSQGKSELLVRAELNGNVQYIKRSVNVLSLNFFNLLKGFNIF